MTPDDIARSLDDQDEFEPVGCTCSAADYGGDHDEWCPYYINLDDDDEFVHSGIYCDHCHEEVEQVFPISDYEPQLSDKVCAKCLEIANEGPQDDRWLTFREALEDSDEFGNMKVIEAFEESGADWAKMLLIYEDGARLYVESKVSGPWEVGQPQPKPATKMVLKAPDGRIHSGLFDVSQPAPTVAFVPYTESMWTCEDEHKPFTSEAWSEWKQAMRLWVQTEGLDDKDEFTRFEDTPISAKLSFPSIMDVDHALNIIRRELDVELERVHMNPTSSFKKYGNLLIYLTPEHVAEINEEFREQFAVREQVWSIEYTYPTSAGSVVLEIPHADNQWMFRIPDPEPPDDYDPEFYKDDPKE